MSYIGCEDEVRSHNSSWRTKESSQSGSVVSKQRHSMSFRSSNEDDLEEYDIWRDTVVTLSNVAHVRRNGLGIRTDSLIFGSSKNVMNDSLSEASTISVNNLSRTSPRRSKGTTTIKDIALPVIIPQENLLFIHQIARDTDLNTLKISIIKKLNDLNIKTDFNKDDLSIFVSDEKGWNIRIGRKKMKKGSAAYDMSYLVTLPESSSIYVCCVYDSIRPRTQLDVLASRVDDYNEDTVKKKINALQASYIGFRTILGDGNDYFRAIIFGLLEQIVTNQDVSKFYELYDVFLSVSYTHIKINSIHSKLSELFLSAGGKFPLCSGSIHKQ